MTSVAVVGFQKPGNNPVLHTLVLPLDGSALAQRAVPYAVGLAQTTQGRLVLMRVALAPPWTLNRRNWEDDQAQSLLPSHPRVALRPCYGDVINL